MKFVETIVINRVPSAVWDVLTDFENYPEWTGNKEKIIIKSRSESKQGLKFQQIGSVSGRNYSIDNKVMEWIDDKKLHLVTTSHYGTGHITYELRKDPEGTWVILTSELRFSKQYLRVALIIYKELQGSMKFFLERLKEHLEKQKLEHQKFS
ncbi:SRPBCC family protein [[Eubacterium] cellulosolvens]